MRKCLISFLILLTLSSCGGKKAKKSEKKKEDDSVERAYFADGKLKTEIPMKDGYRDGLCKNFYSNGKVSLEVNYKNGKREGSAKRYYESGKIYQETEYLADRIEGVRKKFREDGSLMAEEIYKKDNPCKGLKEYAEDGKLMKDFPRIIITPVDKLKLEGDYFLRISLTNESKRVKFYEGKLTPEGCMINNMILLPVDKKKGTAQLRYHLFPGSYKMEEVHIVAVWETSQGSDFITDTSYNLSIEN